MIVSLLWSDLLEKLWRQRIAVALAALAIAALAAMFIMQPQVGQRVLAATGSVEWPNGSTLINVITLRDYNTRIVVIGTTMLGMTAGLIGSFLLLRRRALLGDALSHATLPGIALAFMAAVMLGATGRNMIVLLTGATLTGTLGAAAVLAIRRYTRIKEDAALGIVLSVFFGAGASLMGVVQNMDRGHAAGLTAFIYGKTAAMSQQDAMLILIASLIVALACVLLFKEFRVLCFDQDFAASQGWPVLLLDALLMALAIAVTVIGLQAVGLILIIALLIIPPAAARFWTHRLLPMVCIAAAIGGFSAASGALISAIVPNIPSGPMIVLVAATCFAGSMFFAPGRGVVPRWIEYCRLKDRVATQHLLRAVYELCETAGLAPPAHEAATASSAARCVVAFDQLLTKRAWSPTQLRRILQRTMARELMEPVTGSLNDPTPRYVLTDRGLFEARRITRNHRLWELYLITHAEIAPSHVDRDADEVEHVLGHDLTRQLETLLAEQYARATLPPSPHTLGS